MLDPDSADYPSSAGGAPTLDDLDTSLVGCRACPRLVAWRESVATEKRAAFRDDEYWGRPVPGFGDPDAPIVIVGLAPAAHGANRTGRVFTGDRSGDFLFAGLYRAGLANQPTSVSRGDGLELSGVRISAPVRCAPPANKPTPLERRRCAPWLARELQLLGPSILVLLALGAFGWNALLASLTEMGWGVPRPAPGFAHGAEVGLVTPDGRTVTLIGCFHVSQQNTFTGKLTPQMLDHVLDRAFRLSQL
ncbi:MAG: uracil-DNA glycosylase [Propionibacteriaceae bacterium]|nr:uracil-DNA glycosylase [Propionibacteriaceae bacterium]